MENFVPITDRDFSIDLQFTAVRSSGPGGQNVNKVSSKVELRFDISQSLVLLADEKQFLHEKWAKKLTTEGVLILTCQTERSQIMNKQLVIKKFYDQIKKAFTPIKKRKKVGIPASVKRARLENKRIKAEKKETRKRPLI